MGSDAPDLEPTDLFLLVAHLVAAKVCTLDTLDNAARKLTGLTHVSSRDGRRVSLSSALADWQIHAVSEGLLTVGGTMSGAVTHEPPVSVTDVGRERLVARVGVGLVKCATLAAGERALVARALGLPPTAGPQRMKRLDTAAGLRLAIVRRSWGLRVPESATTGQVRSALAARALGDAFGKPVERQIGLDHRMSGKAARTIAAQLLTRTRRLSSDAQLMTALATQHLDLTSGDLKSLRQALIRKHFGFGKKEQSRADPATLDSAEAPSTRTPDPNAFLRAVRSSAKLNADGWSGNRKAYISHVWRTICDSHPDWRLTVERFKTMLAEAHRLGEVVLVNADLRDKANMRDVQDSAVQYKNMEWHFVQIAD